jgi:hypothetical protein
MSVSNGSGRLHSLTLTLTLTLTLFLDRLLSAGPRKRCRDGSATIVAGPCGAPVRETAERPIQR